MAEQLAQQAGAQMPFVACPHTLDSVALDELPDHRLDESALLDQPARPVLSLPERGEQSQSLLGQTLPRLRTVVVAVAECPSVGSLQQVGLSHA